MCFFMLKPEVLNRKLQWKALTLIESHGYEVISLRMTVPTRVQWMRHYSEHSERHFFLPLINAMHTHEPIIFGTVQHPDKNDRQCVEDFRKLVGPYSNRVPGTLRYEFAVDDTRNGVHASDSLQAMKREFRLWFD